MKFLLKVLLGLFFVLLAGVLITVALILEDRPTVPGQALVESDLREARVFIENSDPRRLRAGELSEFTISDQDLELLLNYLLDVLQRGYLQGGHSEVRLDAGVAELRLSAQVPANPLGAYLNLRIVLNQEADQLVLDSLQAGELTIPRWLADPLMQRAHGEMRARIPEYRASLAAIDSFAIAPGRLNVVYRWQPELLEQLSSRGTDLLLGEADRIRLLAHSQRLTELLAGPAMGARVPLVDVLAPMFAFALERQGDPVEENRAALLVLSLYITETDPARLLGEDAPEPQRRELILAGRHDRAQHFLISAGLTVSAGTGVAQSLGLLKEVDDSQEGGSGFSFVDIGADRTGIRFAELAVAGPKQARTLQERVAMLPDEGLFMANFRDLPELLSDEAFRQTYGGVGQPAYDAMLRDIDARIDNMPLFVP
jgi:hypothetical protein